MEIMKLSEIDLSSLPDGENKYKLGLKINGGVDGDVFQAVDNQTGKNLAIKVMEWTKDLEERIKQEYYVYKELSNHNYFPEFYGAFLSKGRDGIQKIWFVIEFCEGGAVSDFSIKVEQQNQRISESFIAYILRETIKAVIYLHENNICHRDIRGNNILLTADGKIKLIDFGISCRIEGDNKLKTCLGSPNWMAPEMLPNQNQESINYDKKIDIWALGITAIEIGDSEPPFKDVHPGWALFQIIKDPPPVSKKFSERSILYNDFISECLEKDPRNRPYIQELIQHKFLELTLEQECHIKDELKALVGKTKSFNYYRHPEVQVFNGLMKTENQKNFKKIQQEDLANLNEISEDIVLCELNDRLKANEFQTYIGDVLVILNPNKIFNIYGEQNHKRYSFKAKSQNAPHIYAVADSAFRDVFHYEKTQHILFAGETGAGKTVSMLHAVDHLLFLGKGLNISEKIKKALNVIQCIGNAATPYNSNSTRHILQIKITFSNTRKISGAFFNLYQLEKERIPLTDKKQANFHIFYDFYHFMKLENNLIKLYLHEDHPYNLLNLKRNEKMETEKDPKIYKVFEENLRELDFEEDEIISVRKIIAAILLSGEIEFENDSLDKTVVVDGIIVEQVADLLNVDKKKLAWSLVNYTFIKEGEAFMRNHSREEAQETKHMLAKGLIHRIVDWIINKINNKFSISRFTYGDNHIISLFDYFGFECYKKNSLNQLLVNVFNEQFQYYYNQIIFALNKEIAAQEEILYQDTDYCDNKLVVDQISSKPNGILHKIDVATKQSNISQILDELPNSKEFPNELICKFSEGFKIKHYTGTITYDASEIVEKNRNFFPPDLIETMRLSTNKIIKEIFSSHFTKSGNLKSESTQHAQRKVLNKFDDMNITYSQSRQMKTMASNFRGASFNVFQDLMSKDCNFHFVRCIKTDLKNNPLEFNPELVRQQLRALAIVNTIYKVRDGYSYNISFKEFLKRYKFLAFDFDETVEETKENCQLFFIRLKLQGYIIGKTKVFLKYFSKEYLTRLYETQLKKIIKVQSMMRTFIARRKLLCKIKNYQNAISNFSKDNNSETSECQINENYKDSSTEPSEIYSESE